MRAYRRYKLLMLTMLAASCGESGGSLTDPDPEQLLDGTVPPVAAGTWYRPGADVTWQWQLDGEINTTYNVELCTTISTTRSA